MYKHKVEYLILLKENGSFCNDENTFNNLLKCNSEITINIDSINFNGIRFYYNVSTEIVKDKNQRYFKLTIKTVKDSEINDFLKLLRIIKELIHKANGQINILWDDISNYYSIKSYPEINKIENLLRKLITTFMLTNFGMEWTKEATPQEIKLSVKRKNKNENSDTNYLHDTDFIQLADILFKPYHTKDINLLFKELKKINSIQDISLETLKEFIPKSNWERYFKSYVDCEDDYLNKNWARLYDYRCLIAHNSFLTKTDYDSITQIVKDLAQKFEKAIESIDGINIPQSEQSKFLENVAKAKKDNLDDFFLTWDLISYEIKNLHIKKGFKLPDDDNYRIRDLVLELVSNNILTKDFENRMMVIGEFRNNLVTDIDNISDEQIQQMTNEINNFYFEEILIEEPFQQENIS